MSSDFSAVLCVLTLWIRTEDISKEDFLNLPVWRGWKAIISEVTVQERSVKAQPYFWLPFSKETWNLKCDSVHALWGWRTNHDCTGAQITRSSVTAGNLKCPNTMQKAKELCFPPAGQIWFFAVERGLRTFKVDVSGVPWTFFFFFFFLSAGTDYEQSVQMWGHTQQHSWYRC